MGIELVIRCELQPSHNV